MTPLIVIIATIAWGAFTWAAVKGQYHKSCQPEPAAGGVRAMDDAEHGTDPDARGLPGMVSGGPAPAGRTGKE